MKNSLFMRLISTYILVIVLSVGILSMLFYMFFSSYYFKVKEEQLLKQAKDMGAVISIHLKNKEFDEIEDIVEVFNKVSIPHLWVAERDGNIIGEHEGKEALSNTCPERDQLQEALKGRITIKREGVVHGNEPVLSVVLPVYSENVLVGAIFICNSLSEIRLSILNALKTVVIAGTAAVIIVLVVSFFLSRNITRPLKEITEASLEISKGSFTKKLRFNGSDEIGTLSKTFNYMADTLQKTLMELKDERDRSFEMERMQREFVANASHELRTPLTSIRGYLEAMLDNLNNNRETEMKFVIVAHKETLRLHRLANGLLDLAKLENGSIKVHKKEINISQTIQRITEKFKPLAEDHQIELRGNCPVAMPMVLGDEDLIEQIITNYITNAIRFTSEGGEIIISAELQAKEVHIHVRDTGVGIPEKELANVWKRFYKVNESRYQCKEGAGLGLALVRQMVEKLCGRAWATSILGQGSVFSFSLPTNMLND